MDICRCLNTVRFQIFIIGYVRTELIGYIRHGNGCTQPHRLASINFYCHVDDGTAGLCPQLLFCITAQIAAARCVHFTVFQIFNIGVVCTAAGNIPVSHAHCARCFNIVRTADVSMICIFQFGIGQSPRTGKTVCRGSETQAHGSVYLGQRVVGRHGDGIDAGVRAALNAALDVVINFADRRGDSGGNRPASVSRIGKSKIHPAGHLDIPVIGPAADGRTAAAGVGRRIVNQQGMHLAVHLVHRKAKGPGCVGTGTLAVIRHGNAQPGGYFRTHPDRRILNPFRLGNHGIADHGIYILPGFPDCPVILGVLDRIYYVQRHRSTQRPFVRRIVGRNAGSTGKPVHGPGASPGAGEDVIGRLVLQDARTFVFQVQLHPVNHGRNLRVIPVYTDAAGNGRIKTLVGRIVVFRQRLIPLEFELCLILCKHLVKFCNRPANHVLNGIRDIILALINGLVPLIDRIKAFVVF